MMATVWWNNVVLLHGFSEYVLLESICSTSEELLICKKKLYTCGPDVPLFDFVNTASELGSGSCLDVAPLGKKRRKAKRRVRMEVLKISCLSVGMELTHQTLRFVLWSLLLVCFSKQVKWVLWLVCFGKPVKWVLWLICFSKPLKWVL